MYVEYNHIHNRVPAH